jgi:hypothetical protein
MTTINSDTETAEEGAAAPRRSRRRSSDGAVTARRGRRPRVSGDAVVAELEKWVDQLIEENRELKRRLAAAEGGASMGEATKTLAGSQRRVQRALESAPAGRGRRTAAPAAPPKPRRKVTDPVLLERRRAALAKAREARWGKKKEEAPAQ